MVESENEQTLDLIVGHPFKGNGQWGDICEHDDGRWWICGYSRAEHANQGEES